jgi:transmembrane sensor
MGTPNQQELLRMIESYLDGSANDKLKSTVEQYYDLFNDEPALLDDYTDNDILGAHDRIREAISTKIQAKEKNLTSRPWRYMRMAATVFLVVGVGLYVYDAEDKSSPVVSRMKMLTDISPGGNRAVLTLADGRKLSLINADSIEVPDQRSVMISKAGDSALVYESNQNQKAENMFNILETPNGGQYQVTLPDGTKVWLNTSSSLRFPLTFPKNQRTVELDGEAYFEVSKNKNKPFIVKTQHQTVEVLGTRFNLNAYKDEPVERTSLLDGRILVTNTLFKSERILQPGQQSIVTDQKLISVKNIDIDEPVGWKNGYFIYDEERLETILRMVARWYSVEIDYSRAPFAKNLVFSGILSKYSNVSKLLEKLQLTRAIKFEISNNKIIVLPYTSY